MDSQATASPRAPLFFLRPTSQRAHQFRPQANATNSAMFEEIAYVGRRPGTGQLETVVYIKQPSGYGEHQGEGSLEYLRFYLSDDRGAHWTDHGSVWFPVWDIPTGDEGVRPLAFGVHHPIQDWLDPAGEEQSITVRAILSWNEEPPPQTPGFKPKWGCICDTRLEPEHQWGQMASGGVLGFA